MNNESAAKNLTFWELLKENTIEIPIIQRDYAQGRQENTSIRNNILDSFYKALTNEQSLELDFIYASESNKVIQPLDGQQRLTTLFLLHWYISSKENKLNAETQDILKKFTYETRTSSREFCQKLVNSQIQDLLVTFLKIEDEPSDSDNVDKDKDNSNKLSNAIKNSEWFVLSWQKDPTIKSMLNMLDTIDAKFKDTINFWEKLVGSRLITFSYITLEKFGLSDDLYIKMNARGKALTDFENFKAILEKKINEEKWESNLESGFKKFADKVDTDWTEFLWQYKDEKFLIDDSFMKVVALHLITQLKGQENNDTTKRKEVTDKITSMYNNPNSIMPEDFDKDSYDFIVKTLDSYAKTNISKLNLEFPVWQLQPKDTSIQNFFESLLIANKDKTYSQVLMSYAQTLYLLRNENFDKQAFSDWMRVIRNIVLNSTIDSAEPFLSATNLVKELSFGCSEIYGYLSNNKIASNFARNQVQEEIQKAKVIVSKPDSKQAIQNIEDTNFFRGHIRFALYCIDYQNQSDEFDINLLKEINAVFDKYFDNSDDFDNSIRRALLTIGDNKFYEYWGSWLFAVDSPKRCFIENIADLRYFAYNKDINGENGMQFREYLKILILKLTNKSVDEITDEFKPSESMPDWKVALIKHPKLMDFTRSHYFAKSSDESMCWLIPAKRVENSDAGKGRLLSSDTFNEYLAEVSAN